MCPKTLLPEALPHAEAAGTDGPPHPFGLPAGPFGLRP
jgi:hypothetical protein